MSASRDKFFLRNWIYEIQPRQVLDIVIDFDFKSIPESSYANLFHGIEGAFAKLSDYPRFEKKDTQFHPLSKDLRTLFEEGFSSKAVKLSVGLTKSSFRDEIEIGTVSSCPSLASDIGMLRVESDENEWPSDIYQLDGHDKVCQEALNASSYNTSSDGFKVVKQVRVDWSIGVVSNEIDLMGTVATDVIYCVSPVFPKSELA